jgi:choline dehydrogenase-like flavoprotein
MWLARMRNDSFDVVIVGSGASGGTLAAHLARPGVRVAVEGAGSRFAARKIESSGACLTMRPCLL